LPANKKKGPASRFQQDYLRDVTDPVKGKMKNSGIAQNKKPRQPIMAPELRDTH
jgi:hypothetical protein